MQYVPSGMETFKKKKFFEQYKVQWSIIIVMALIFVPFFVIGVAQAYDNWILNQMENALANNVKAAHESLIACESNYQALLQYKTDNKIALVGTPDPCTF